MTLDDLIATGGPPATPEGLRGLLSTLMSADDITRDERGALFCGYIIGLGYALAAGVEDAATELRLRLYEVDEL